jgi:hypothetical protein
MCAVSAAGILTYVFVDDAVRDTVHVEGWTAVEGAEARPVPLPLVAVTVKV